MRGKGGEGGGEARICTVARIVLQRGVTSDGELYFKARGHPGCVAILFLFFFIFILFYFIFLLQPPGYYSTRRHALGQNFVCREFYKCACTRDETEDEYDLRCQKRFFAAIPFAES